MTRDAILQGVVRTRPFENLGLRPARERCYSSNIAATVFSRILDVVIPAGEYKEAAIFDREPDVFPAIFLWIVLLLRAFRQQQSLSRPT
jgi:hypothetical protein